ncbi:zinc-binding dehydrogenase [Rhodococcus sp. OK302]
MESDAIDTTIDSIFPLDKVAEAHRHFDSGVHIGKVLLDCRTANG